MATACGCGSEKSFYHLLQERKTLPSSNHYKLQHCLSKNLFTFKTSEKSRAVPVMTECPSDYPYGSVFNVEFTPAGNAVVVAHANKAFTIHDTRLEKCINVVPNAHDDCVNIVSFLNDLNFVTGSDDGTIRLWDLRHLTRKPIGILRGHEGWVKNVELDKKSGLLFSIAFNDGVRKWKLDNLDAYKSAETADNLLFELKGGVRMKLAPDNSKMVISLRRDHLFLVSNFDGATVGKIWNGFPKQLPLSKEDEVKMATQMSETKTNIPSVHAISPFAGANYRTPLSFCFHPCSQFMAMRMIDVKKNRLVQEISVLYNLDNSTDTEKPFYTVNEVSSRFLKYIDECSPETALDFIKEITFSSDGRFLLSPYGNSVRLLAVDSHYTPMGEYYDERYQSREKRLKSLDMESVCVCTGHTGPVLTSRLNSWDMCLVSGCIKGKITFYWPRL